MGLEIWGFWHAVVLGRTTLHAVPTDETACKDVKPKEESVFGCVLHRPEHENRSLCSPVFSARGSSKSRSIQLQVHCPCLGLVDGSSSLCATLNTARRAIPELPSAFIQLKAWKTFHQKPRSADKTAASLINRREAKAVMSWL